MKKFFLLIPLFFVSCEKDYYREAQLLDKSGKKLEAAHYYEKYSLVSKKGPEFENSLMRAGQIYREFGLCSKAAPFFEKIARLNAGSEISSKATKYLYLCPQYYPDESVKILTYGDSQTYGKNAIEELSFKKSLKDKSLWIQKIYAGKKLISKSYIEIGVEGLFIFEKKGVERREIIKYPIRKNLSWVYNGRTFKIGDLGIQVNTKAGSFSGCIKVLEYYGDSFRQVFYYAPRIGRVLSTIEHSGKETRITELISYERR